MGREHLELDTTCFPENLSRWGSCYKKKKKFTAQECNAIPYLAAGVIAIHISMYDNVYNVTGIPVLHVQKGFYRQVWSR